MFFICIAAIRAARLVQAASVAANVTTPVVWRLGSPRYGKTQYCSLCICIAAIRAARLVQAASVAANVPTPVAWRLG